MTTLSSREINQDFGRAKKASSAGPVIITDRGKPSHVLMSIEDFNRSNDNESVVDGLSSDDAIDFDQYLPGRSSHSRKVIFS